MKIKKILLFSASVIAIYSSAIAAEVETQHVSVTSDLNVKLSGYAQFQTGYKNQSKLAKDEKKVSHNKEAIAFYSDVALVADASTNVNDIKYGGKIVLVPTAKRKGAPDYNGSHIYIEGDHGRVELGSPVVPSGAMMIDGGYVGAATVDAWSRYANTAPESIKQGKNYDPSFACFSEFFMDSKLETDLKSRPYSNEPGRSIVYYTPKYDFAADSKIQIGISYTPDSSNTGADNPGTKSSGKDVKKIEDEAAHIYKFVFDRSVKDAITGGVTLETEFEDGIDLKFAITGETGAAAGKAQRFAAKGDKKPDATFKLSPLRAFNVGAVLNFGSFSYAAGYGTLGKSLTTPEFHKTGRITNYYSGSVAYKQGSFATSISYFKSSQFKNTVDVVAVGTNYKLAPGFSPYAEIATFSLKGKPEFNPELPAKKTNGVAVLLGARLNL